MHGNIVWILEGRWEDMIGDCGLSGRFVHMV
jgi:hypothetical protein